MYSLPKEREKERKREREREIETERHRENVQRNWERHVIETHIIYRPF